MYSIAIAWAIKAVRFWKFTSAQMQTFSVKYVVGHHGLVQTFIARVWIISLFGGKSALLDKVVG